MFEEKDEAEYFVEKFKFDSFENYGGRFWTLK